MKLILPIEVAGDIEPHLPQAAQIVCVDSDGNLDGDSSDAEVYLSWFHLQSDVLDKILMASPALRWHHTPSAGVDHILTPAFLSRDIVLTNGAGIHAIPIAEFVLSFMLYHAKHLQKLQCLQAEHSWLKGLELQELMDKTVLIVGAGGIGQEIAKRAQAFGMRVWGSRRNPQPLPEFERVVGAEWRSLLPDADYVVIATPLTQETTGMVNEAVLRSMRQSAYLINIGRGAVIDEAALLTALRQGWIAGAGLDTFSTEPLPPDSPFWSLANVFITPHCAGGSPREQQRSIALFLDNLQRYRDQLPLRNVVDKQAGY